MIKFISIVGLMTTVIYGVTMPSAVFAFGDKVEVCFSPQSQEECSCQGLVIDTIQQAEHTIAVSIYSLTDIAICNALTDAHYRGVKVDVTYNIPAGIHSCVESVQAENKVAIKGKTEHNKYLIVDGVFVVTGSYNFTRNGNEYNYENCIKVEDNQIARRYLKDFNKKIAGKFYQESVNFSK